MASPVLNDDSLRLRGGSLVNDRWSFQSGSIVVVQAACPQSGESNYQVSLLIDWGDGLNATEREVTVGHRIQFEHVFEEPGDYSISLQAVNSSGLRSASKSVPIRIEPIKARQRNLSKWRGLALPVATLGTAIEAVQSVFPATDYRLAAGAITGERRLVIVVVGDASDLLEAEYVLTQPGRLISSGRVLAVNGSILTVDTDLVDDYDPQRAVLEVVRRPLSSRVRDVINSAGPGLFLVSTDEALVRGSFIMNLATRRGERLMLPEFGSNLHEIPFEQNDVVSRRLLMLETADPVQQWEPRAEIKSLEIKSQDDVLSADLTYAYAGDSTEVAFSAQIPLALGGASE